MTTDLLVNVRSLEPHHEQQWRALWRQYLDFYGAEISPAATTKTWQRILAGTDVLGLAAVRSTDMVGFAIAVLHEATWSLGRTCYLEDLFVRSDQRGRGAGRKLIDELIRRSRLHGCATLYWHTRASNAPARRLYDSYVPADDFVRYRLSL